MIVSESAGVLSLDPEKARKTGRGVSLDAKAIVPNLLLWLDAARAKEQKRVSRARRAK